MKRNIIFFLIFSMSAVFPASAETIKLKSGQEVEGRIIEMTRKEIKIDFMGVPLTYFIQDIESIDGTPLEPSERVAQQAIPSVAPVSAQDYFYLGVSNGKKGDTDQAISDFSKAIELDPGLVEAYHNRGLSFLKKKNYDFAIDDFNKSIEINPKYREAYNNRAVAYYNKEEYDMALKDVKKAQELGYQVNPKFVAVLKKIFGKSKGK